jgi:hypothetical protein
MSAAGTTVLIPFARAVIATAVVPAQKAFEKAHVRPLQFVGRWRAGDHVAMRRLIST